MTDATSTAPSEDGAMGRSIRWPPPGLERLQGDLMRVASRAALGGGILVLPLLFVLGREQDFATLGPFADAWWVTLVLAVAGLAFAADALIRTMTLLRRVSEALKQGYAPQTIRMVIADGDRDMGFLVTGGRHFSQMDAKEREAIGSLRVFAAMMYAVAGVWLPNALAIGIVLGAHGLLTPAGLWMSTALPSLAMYTFGAVAGTMAESRVRRARRAWHGQPWPEDLGSDEAGRWRAALPSHVLLRPPPEEGRPSPRLLRHASILMGVLAALVSVPILTLVPTAAVGPILTTVAVPGFDNVRARGARVEALRRYRVPVDPGLGPADAGRLLHDLSYAGTDREPPLGVRAPSRRITEQWLPELDETNPTGVHPFDWPDSLLSVVSRGATDEQRALLQDIADHPARDDLSRLAHAERIDIASARYEDPLPEELTLVNLPIPRYTEIRDAAHSHLAAAASELLAGRPERAEELLSEVVSLGFLLGDGGLSLMDNLIGYALVEQGAEALGDLYTATGQTGEAARLAELRAAADAAVARVRFAYPDGSEAWVRSLPGIVSDTSVARGLRWEIFIGLTTLTPCINLQRLVFGPDDAYWSFVDGARADLVRWPSEDGLFELARNGWFHTRGDTPATLLGRLLSVSMRTGEGTCGETVRRLEAAEAL